jgi:hypothetical protein
MPTWTPDGTNLNEAARWAAEQRAELRRLDFTPARQEMGPIVARCCQCGSGADAETQAIVGTKCPRRYVDGCDGWLEAVR